MDGSVDRMSADLIRDLNAGKLSYEDAKARYRELGDRLQSEYPPDRTPLESFNEANVRYRQLGEAIQRRYQHNFTAVSVDVVGSREMKLNGTPLDAQLTFDAYHQWVEEKLATHGCPQNDYAWAGDGLIAIFELPETAVQFGKALIGALPVFNTCFNRLHRPFQLRIGVHTGPVLPGERHQGLGRRTSATLDLAGHYQKAARPDEMIVSPTTHDFLPEDLGQFASVRRPIPNAESCYAFPPRPDEPVGEPPPPPMPPAASELSSPVRDSGAALVLLGVTIVTAAGLLAGGLFWWASQPPAGGAGNAVVVQVPVQSGGSGPGRSLPSPDYGRPAAPARLPVPVASAPLPPGPPVVTQAPVIASWSPDRQLWRSPDAESGVPSRLFASTPDRTWILAVGVGVYQEAALKAVGAGGDALLAAQVLQRATGTPTSNVRVLADGQATLENVKRSFQWIQQNANSGRDTVFVYLAGAGRLAPDRAGMHHSAGSGYAFAPYDARSDDPATTWVYGADLSAWLGAARIQTMLLLVDTPYSGAIQADLPAEADPGRRFGLLAATSAEQRSIGRGTQASAFAEALAAALQGGADQDRDRRVSMPELQSYLAGSLPRTTNGYQTPVSAAGFGGYLPELYFAVR